MIWHCQRFEELSPHTLYDLLKLRCDVFVVEQNCPYPELDGLDTLPDTRHLFAVRDNTMVAYARLLAKNVSYEDHTSIGRVVVSPKYRKEKIGHALINKAIQETLALWPDTNIQIGAQFHLKHVYESHGFNVASDPYLEDGIKHCLMKRVC
ncbi:GNAT family N-acetyltransferase [Marinomonas hwangdonensis]|uniref:GNAT family N-acetyltransferase n=1 Tax=Marinomonas hwangdonensis TaxID=1053647 RepID=A0A3M8Q9V1_9GAMM|nr:GNAT family N-acetyltransferase [Marinomonas hwangdonensis]RNF52837.1 GNAT family N-acetyltransferase [Marinomonas hwangdonensis]